MLPALARLQSIAAGNAIHDYGAKGAVEVDLALLGCRRDLELLNGLLNAPPATAQRQELRVKGGVPTCT